MKVGIVGSGDVAKALARGFLKHGHSVVLGTRNPAKLADFLKEAPRASSDSPVAAIGLADLVVLAVKGTAALDAFAGPASAQLDGKIVIDATNPIADAPPVNGVLQYFTGPNESLMERLQAAYPQTKFVKAFNSVGNADMVDPDFPGGRPSMFICGNDPAAKKVVAGVLDEFGWDVEDMGGAEAARAIEPLCMLWCVRGFLYGQWHHAFKLLR